MDDDGIWDQRGTLTRSHALKGDVEVPRLPEERAEPRPLRDVLGIFASASPAERERFTLILENGQAFSADDISEMLERPDSPF